jgi:hypothetical protein
MGAGTGLFTSPPFSSGGWVHAGSAVNSPAAMIAVIPHRSRVIRLSYFLCRWDALVSRKHFTDDMASHIRQSPLHAVVLKSQGFVVEAQQVQYGGVEVVKS